MTPRSLPQAGIAALLLAATAVVYLQVRHHEFVRYDDFAYIVDNPSHLRGLGLRSARDAFRPYHDNWIPLTWLSLQLDHAIHGPRPAAFLLTNAALHALAAVLLLGALARMTGALGPSAFVAAVFALHPLHVESVAWASERKDVLSGVFFALTLCAWARYAERPGAGRYGLVLLWLALGLLSKPMLVTLPALLLLLDHWPLGRLRGGGEAALRRACVEKLPLLVPAIAVGAVTIAVQRASGATAFGETLPLSLRLANGLESYVVYAWKSLWPSGLAIFYPHPERVPAWRAIAAAALLGAVSVAAWRARRSHPYLLVGWLWYLGMLLPVIGILQVGLQARADRYTYLPQIGLGIAAAWGARDLLGRTPARRRALAACACAAAVALAAASWRQVRTWRNTETLFERALAVTGPNAVAHQQLGSELLRRGEIAPAAAHFREALRLRPDWSTARLGLAEVLARRGEREAAIAAYEAALALEPSHAGAHAKLGLLLSAAGRASRARAHLERAVALHAGTGAGAREAAVAHLGLAELQLRQGDLASALAHAERGVQIHPASPQGRTRLGMLLAEAGRAEEAIAQLERARALGAESAELFAGLGRAYQTRGRPRAAAHHYREALRRRPGPGASANNLAWILATSADPALRDADEAIRLAESSVAADPEDPALLDTLAAGYAAAGRFDAARRTAERAVALAAGRGQSQLAAAIRAHLALYREGRALREGPAPGP